MGVGAHGGGAWEIRSAKAARRARGAHRGRTARDGDVRGADRTVRLRRHDPPRADEAPLRGPLARDPPPLPRHVGARRVRLSPLHHCGLRRILGRHILPTVTAPVIILATIGLGTAILAGWALSSLGFGVPPPYPAWGAMLSGSGRTYMFRAPWMAIWPGVAISLAVFGFNMLGDALRDILDPRLRGGAR